jgi:hypothetical protein
MEVKIYREPENIGLLLDENELEEYQKLAEEIGIPEVKPDKIPSVYQTLNSVQVRALDSLCPCKVKLENYNRSTIPVEVLRAVKLIKENEMFDFIKVWYDDKEPDPIIVGEKYRTQTDREKGYDWNTEKILIARWGDCAYELPELVDMGRERLKQEFTEKAIVAQQKIESFLKYPELYVNKFLNTGEMDFQRI